MQNQVVYDMRVSDHPMKKVAVIGAGLSGLVAIKELIGESHSVVCFEQEDDIGGAFYNKEDKDGIYNYMHLTVSNFFMCFSSFLAQEKRRRYWTASEYIEYLQSFCEMFSLKKYIRFNTEVLDVTPSDEETWRITYKKPCGEIKYEYVDSVAICSGKFKSPFFPDLPGIDKFRGKIHHSYNYKGPEAFSGKKVVCVGVGESGSDVVHQISKVASQAHLVVNRPKSIISRKIFGDTGDSRTTRAAHHSFLVNQSVFEASLKKRVIEKAIYYTQKKSGKDFKSIWMWKYLVKYGLHGEFSNKNDIFFQDIDYGRLKLHLFGIERFYEDGVVLGDGSRIECSDVMLSTGYKTKFEIINHPAARDVEKSVRSNLFHMIHPSLRESMVWLGFVRPDVGGVPTISELQARYYSKLLAGKLSLPNKKELISEVARLASEEEFHFSLEKNKSENVKYFKITNYLANKLGVNVKWYKLIWNPRLLFNVYHGSMVAAQFRLFGEDRSFKEAKSFINKVGVTKAPLSHLAFFIPFTTVMSVLSPLLRIIFLLLKVDGRDANKKGRYKTVSDIIRKQWPDEITVEPDKESRIRDLFSADFQYEGFRFFLANHYGVDSKLTSDKEMTVGELDSLLNAQFYPRNVV